MLHILSGDIQIADRMVRIPTDGELRSFELHKRAKLQALVALLDETLAGQGARRGQKAKISPEQFAEFSIATSGLEGKTEPGGSSANTLATLSKLLPGKIAVDMFGVVGVDENSHRIRGALTEAGITLLPKTYQPGQIPEAATSFVFQEGGGRRTIVTYPGNARDILVAEMITPELVRKNDVVFVQGSLWEKLDESFPDALLKGAKQIWLALPTHANFRDDMTPGDYRRRIPAANVVLGNDEELMRIYETPHVDEAIAALQASSSLAFITCGKEGAVVVTPELISKIAPPDVSHLPQLYSVGAGDNAYAGFLAGYIAGLSPEESAQLGMQVAGAKEAFDAPRMRDPRAEVQAFSELGRRLLAEVDGGV